MAFEITKQSETSNWYVPGERLWLTADRERVVKEDDPEAAFLFATPSDRVSVEDAERYGLVPKKGGSKAREKPATKESKPEADKQAAPENAKAMIARMGEMSEDELAGAAKDKRKSVAAKAKAELKKRAGR